jgi:hypothetical protein
MKKILTISLCIMVSALMANAQSKPKTAPKTPQSELLKLLAGTGLPYKAINDSLAVIPYEGINIESYNVVVQKASDLYIIYTDLLEILPGKIDESKYKYFLLQNDHFDIVKIGISSDEKSIYVRADLYEAGISTALLGRVIKQVANVTNIIAGEIK